MSLWIEVYIGQSDNKKLVAKSVAHNISNLSDTSNYYALREEFGAEHLGIKPNRAKGQIRDHWRSQSVWSLVKKIASWSGEECSEESLKLRGKD